MAWLSIVALILQVLGPLVRAWLADRLRAAAEGMDLPPSDPGAFRAELGRLFDRAERGLPARRLLAVRVLRRAVLRQAEGLRAGGLRPFVGWEAAVIGESLRDADADGAVTAAEFELGGEA